MSLSSWERPKCLTSRLFLFEFPPQLQTEQTSLQDNTRMSIICRQQPRIYPNCTQHRKLLMTFMWEVKQDKPIYGAQNLKNVTGSSCNWSLIVAEGPKFEKNNKLN
ncbi:hypothetical protein L3Q82_018202 [Scortum barcoo]|uniref:Uncharacterized protein n=1 Tax=Scortum barcoo TaxID=214431 RepID=A0ACB8VI62_9TELE|nr:hypothetical protein L3Q82_018202 [Scortum barcoo]